MSTQQEQPAQSASSAGNRSEGPSSHEDRHHDVWAELFGTVHGLAETLGLALQAFTPSDDKAVSAITKKRLALRSVQGLKQGQIEIQTLLEHLKALQAASQTWQRSMMYASKSHQELMEQIESTTEELHTTSERLRVVEAQRLAAVRDAESLRARTVQQEAVIKEVQSSLKHREEELETLQFTVDELQSSTSVTQQSLEQLRQSAAHADERALAATAAFDEAKADATKAQGLAERHQQVVAKLTADNLVFLMQLKKAEADLAASNQERSQLRLAAEKQRGPWFDQVRAGVEERVRQALQRSQELETQIERQEAEHAGQVQAMQAQRAELEEQLDSMRRSGDELQERLGSALESKQRADELNAAAQATADELRQRLDDLAAENRVLQESVRAMRQECTERWVSEQAALSRVGGLEEGLEELERSLSHQATQAAALQRQLDTQAGVNRQLMARKEEVEWQLMAAMAKVDGGTGDQPVPLNLRVSGLLQVGGQKERTGTEAPAPAYGAAGRAEWTASGAGTELNRASSSGGIADASSSLQLQPSHATPAPARAGAGQYASAGSKPLADGAAAGSSPYTGGMARRGSLAAGVLGYSELAFGLGSGGGDQQYQRPMPSWPHAPQYHVAPHPESTAGESPASEPMLFPEPTLQLANHDAVAMPPYGQARVAVAAGRAANEQGPAQLRRASATRHDAAGEMHGRGASVEGASTVVSSPPSSVALSSEPGSPREVSQVPSATSGRLPGAAAVTIRTMSAGPRPPGEGRDGAISTGQAASYDRGEDPDDASARAYPRSRADQGGTDTLGRRGSLHEGGDVWLADMASSASSDDSDFFFPGRMVAQQEARGSGMAPAPHQALLHQLQQQLQVHWQTAPVVVGSGASPGPQPIEQRGSWGGQAQHVGHGGSGGTSAAPSGLLEQTRAQASSPGPSTQVVLPALSRDDDVFHTRSVSHRSGESGAGGRPTISMRTGPSRPVGASQGGGSAAAAPSGTSSSMHARNERSDPAAGIFSIVKGSGAMQEARAGPSGSPVHPAFSGSAPRQSYPASCASPPSSPGPRPVTAAGTSGDGSAGQRSRMPASGPTTTTGTFAAHAAAPHAAGATADTVMGRDPVSMGAYSGASFYPTGAPLSGSAAAAIERWASSDGARGAPQMTSTQHHQQVSVPPSPTRSTASRSPRSPTHPALVLLDARPGGAGGPGVGEVFAGRDLALGSRADSITGGPTSAPGVQPERSARHVGAEQLPGSKGGPVTTASAADVPMAASARPRVSFHGLVQGSQEAMAAADGSSSGVLTHARASSLSSIPGSSMYANGSHSNGTGVQPHKPSSVKSVRFSDHEPEDYLPQQQLQQHEDQEHSGMGLTMRAGLRASASQSTQETHRRPQSQQWVAPGEGERKATAGVDTDQRNTRAGGSNGPQPYRSQGPVLHPALLGSGAAAASASWSTSTTSTGDVPEATPSKRYSAAGVAMTAVPRGPAALP